MEIIITILVMKMQVILFLMMEIITYQILNLTIFLTLVKNSNIWVNKTYIITPQQQILIFQITMSIILWYNKAKIINTIQLKIFTNIKI